MKRIFSFLFFAETQKLPLKFEEIWKKSKYPGGIWTSTNSDVKKFGLSPNQLNIASVLMTICYNV